MAGNWFRENRVNVLIWPPQNPDLNIIENVWGFMANIVYRNGKQHTSKDLLKQAILDAWSELKTEYIQKLYLSIPKRLLDCLNRKGGYTKY